MNVAIFTESPIDDAVLRVFTDHLLGTSTSPTSLPRLASRGWPAMKRDLPAIIRAVHYQSLAEAVVVCADANGREVHAPEHVGQPTSACRHCELQSEASRTLDRLPATQLWHPLKVAITVPCPSIEAWLLCGRERDCTEAAWKQRREAKNAFSEIKRLKKLLYGSEAPHSHRLAIENATRRGTELLSDLGHLEWAFPNSFGVFAATVRGWAT